MTARKYFEKLGGFTLVELLIVIALLAIIALIVIAAINPIEQANRARDTGMKSDAAQLLSSIDRYFAAKQTFPWTEQDSTNTDEGGFGFVSVGDYHVGLCAVAGCVTAVPAGSQGVLITNQELKPEFKNRRFIDAHVATPQLIEDMLVIGKADQDQSVYVCYIPKANSSKSAACTNGWVYQVSVGDGADGDDPGTKTPFDCSATPITDWAGNDIATSYWVCVPE